MCQPDAVEPGWIDVDGMRLRYLDTAPDGERGDGPPLFIIPGHTARIDGYLPIAELLAPHRRVLIRRHCLPLLRRA